MAPPTYEFGPYRLDPVKRLLWREGERFRLAQKPLSALLVLVENHGRSFQKKS